MSALPALSLGAGTYDRMVLSTNCIVDINGGAILQDVAVFTTSTDAMSVKINTAGGGGFQLGKNDGCAAGGGAQIVTRGGFKQSAKMNVYNGQIIALGSVDFAAQATGNGVSIVAGGMIDGTTNMTMSACPTGQEDNFEASYFRLAG